jgi:hypothetical protein
MPLPFDVLSTVEQTRKENRRRVQQERTELSAVLGNENNTLYVAGKNGNEVYIRLLGDAENGNATYLPSTTAFIRGDYFEYSGSPILVKYNNNGDLVLIGPDETQVAQAGDTLSLATLNSGSKQSKWLNLDYVTRLVSRPVSRGDTDSLLVSVAQFIYDHYGSYVEFNGTPLKADKVDLSSYIPAAGTHRIAQLWLDTYNNSVQVTTSTAQSIDTALGSTDYDEAWLGSNRYQDWLPLQAYALSDAMVTITQQDLARDNRQFVNIPNEIGNEYELTVNTRIRANRQWAIQERLTVPAGYTLAIEAGGVVHIAEVASALKNPVEFIDFVTDYIQSAPEPEGRIWWNGDEYTLNISTGLGPVLQTNQETVIVFYNNTGSQIDNGTLVRPVGAFEFGGVTFGTFEKAQADTFENCEGTIILTTMDIPAATVGIGTRFGRVRGVDTSGFTGGDDLYLSATTAGAVTNVLPSFPNYEIKIGGAVKIGVSDGEIGVSVTTDIFDTLRNLNNGTFRESFDFLVTSNGSTITGTLTPTNGHDDMTAIFSDGFYLLDTSPGATITLTPGTDTAPQVNYVYIPQSTKVLTVSTSEWPTTIEHIRVAQVFLQSAATTETNGALRNQNWNDEIQDTTTNQGHLSHVGKRIRQLAAAWDNGAEGSISGTTADVWVSTTAGVVFQMHEQNWPILDMIEYTIDAVSTGSKTFTISDDGDLSGTFPDGRTIQVNGSTGNDGLYTIASTNYSAPDFVITVEETIASAVADGTIGDDIVVINDPTTPYRSTTNLNDLTVDSTNTSLTNRWFSIVVWGVMNKSGEVSHLICNLPSGSYATSESVAIADASGYTNFTIPKDFQGVGFLIARFTMRKGAGSTFTYNSGTGYQDLRGFFPNTTAGASTGSSGISTFLGLTDTPASYAGSGGYHVQVNSGATALEFVAPQAEITDELTTLTANAAAGSPDYAIQDLTTTNPYGFVTADEGQTVLQVIINNQARINELETALVNANILLDAD